jgi:segregation and condensation protein B
MSEQDNHNLRLLEAILFAAEEPLSPQALYERMGEDIDVGALLRQVQQRYAGAGINLVERDGRWAFRTAEDLADHLALNREEQRKLSRAALETLAIIAYHQPVTRAEIETIRGVSTSRGTLDTLMEAGWVKPGRRRESPGRPATWVTTPEFLDHFGLESIRDLPGLEELKASGLLDKRPAIETVPDTGDMFDDADEAAHSDDNNETLEED